MPEISASSQIRISDSVANNNFIISSTDKRVTQATVDGYIEDGVFLIPLSARQVTTGVNRRERGVVLTFFGTGSAGDAFSAAVHMGKYGYDQTNSDLSATEEIELNQILTITGVLANITGSGTVSCIRSNEKCGSELVLTESTLLSVLEGSFGSPGTDVSAEAGTIGKLIIPETFGAAFLLVDTRVSVAEGQALSCGVIYELID